SGEIIPTALNASALQDPDGKVIGAIGILHDMRGYERAMWALQESKTALQEKILDLEKFEEVVVGRELKMIALEKELESLRQASQLGGERRQSECPPYSRGVESKSLHLEAWMSTRSWKKTPAYVRRCRCWKPVSARTRSDVVPSCIS